MLCFQIGHKVSVVCAVAKDGEKPKVASVVLEMSTFLSWMTRKLGLLNSNALRCLKQIVGGVPFWSHSLW